MTIIVATKILKFFWSIDQLLLATCLNHKYTYMYEFAFWRDPFSDIWFDSNKIDFEPTSLVTIWG